MEHTLIIIMYTLSGSLVNLGQENLIAWPDTAQNIFKSMIVVNVNMLIHVPAFPNHNHLEGEVAMFTK